MEQQAIALIKNMIGQSLIDSIDDSDEIQLVKIAPDLDNAPSDGDDVQDGVERIQEYGITSNPPRDSETVVLYPGGKKDSGIVIKVDSAEYRINSLESGEVCIYSMHGQKILLNKDGDIVFNDGTDFAVGFNELKNGFDLLKTQLNTFIGVYNSHAAKPANDPLLVGVPVTATIDLSKIEEIKLP